VNTVFIVNKENICVDKGTQKIYVVTFLGQWRIHVATALSMENIHDNVCKQENEHVDIFIEPKNIHSLLDIG
jgi:hypothetical protein